MRESVDELDDVGEVTLTAASGFGASNDIEVDITASNAEDLQTATDAIVDELDGIGSITQVSTNLSESRPYIAVEVEPKDAAAAGLLRSRARRLRVGRDAAAVDRARS